MKEQENPPQNLEDVLVFFKNLLENPFSKQAPTETYPESEPGTIRICTTECLWADVFKELDAMDLGDIMLCQTDFPTAEIFHPKLDAADLGLEMMCNHDFAAAKVYNSKLNLSRDKTLMEGHDCCDFVYTWEE